MAFLGHLFGRKTPKPRGPRRSAQERLAAMRVKHLGQLKQTNPERYHALMDSEMERMLNIDPQKQAIDTDTVLRVVEYLRALGLKVVPSKGGTALDDDSLMSFLRDAAPLLRAVVPQMVPQLAAPAAPPPAPAEPAPTPSPAAEAPVFILSRYLISQLDGKTPDQAAQWLVSQPYPQAQQLIDQLRQTPNEQLPELLDAIARAAPDLAGLVAWLRSRPEWLVATVRAVRHLGEKATPAPGGMGL